MSIPMTVFLALALAGVVVPIVMLLTPATLRGDWIAVAVATACVGVALLVRRRTSRR